MRKDRTCDQHSLARKGRERQGRHMPCCCLQFAGKTVKQSCCCAPASGRSRHQKLAGCLNFGFFEQHCAQLLWEARQRLKVTVMPRTGIQNNDSSQRRLRTCLRSHVIQATKPCPSPVPLIMFLVLTLTNSISSAGPNGEHLFPSDFLVTSVPYGPKDVCLIGWCVSLTPAAPHIYCQSRLLGSCIKPSGPALRCSDHPVLRRDRMQSLHNGGLQ